MKSSENYGAEESAEKLLTKAEIDQQIEALSAKRSGLAARQKQLQEGLAELLHSYQSAGEDLGKFKGAKEALEERLEHRTVPDALIGLYRVLLGKELIEGKEDFLEWKPRASVSVDYRKTGGQLRDSVSEVAKNKDVMREAMGENLSFRGGKRGEEDKSPREESIEKITQTISGIDAEIFQLDDRLKQKRGEAYEAWKKENPEEREKIQKKERAVAVFDELVASNPTEGELFQVFRRTDNEYIKKRARLLLIEKAKKEGPKKLLSVFVNYDGLYTAENFNELVSAFNSEPLSEGMKSIYMNLSLLHFSNIDERVVDFAVSNIDINNCSYLGNGHGCERGGCCMISNYWSLPVSVQEKIAGKLENSGGDRSSELVDLFPEVKIAKIKDPLEKAKFTLSLPTEKFGYGGYSPADAISNSQRREAALVYLASGEQDSNLFGRAISFLREEVDKETLGKLLFNLNETQIERGLFALISQKLSKDEDDSSYVNPDVLAKYVSRFTLKSNTAMEGSIEAKERKEAVLDSLGCGEYSGINKSIKAIVIDIVGKYFDEQSNQIRQKERERINKIEEITKKQ